MAPSSGTPGSSSQGGQGQLDLQVTELDFGATPCGTAAGAQMVSVGNTGTAALHVTAAVAGGAQGPFSVAPAEADVPAGGSVMFTVTANAVPVPTALPANLGDALTFTSDIPNDQPRVVQLRQTAVGGVLSVNVTAVPFGLVTAGSTGTFNVEVRNSGNVPVDFTAAVTGDPVFGVMPGTATLAPNQVAILTTTFSPTDASVASGALALAAANGSALCQPAPAGITLTGQGRSGGLRFSPPVVDFGAVDCGGSAMPLRVTAENSGNVPVMWNAMLNNTQDNRYTFARVDSGPLQGSLAAGASVEFEVTTTGIPATSEVTDNLYGASVTFFTDAAESSTYQLQIRQTARGHILVLDPADVDFGNVPTNQTGMQPLRVHNLGNAPATLTAASDNALFALMAPGMTMPAQTTDSFEVVDSVELVAAFSPGMDTTAQMGTVALTDVMGVACQPVGTPANLRGTGTNGSVVFQPTSVNFGNTPCGTVAMAQDVVFTNPGNAAYTITAELTDGMANFSLLLTPPDGVVMPGGSVVVTVVPNGIPAESATPGQYGGNLRVTTTADGDEPHDIPLRQNAYGAILGAPTTNTIMFPATPVNRTASSTFNVPNSGNAPAVLTFATNNSVFSFQNTTAAPATGAAVSAVFAPTMVSAYTDTAMMNVAQGTPLCGPLPQNRSFTLSGAGSATQPNLVAGTTLVDYGAVSCGTQSPVRTVTLRNNGTSMATLSAALASSNNLDNSRFTVALGAGTLAANGAETTLTITPKAIAASPTTNVGEADWSDTVRITADFGGGTTETLNIQVRQVATGAILAWSASGLNIPNNSSRTVQLTNTGNASADVSATVTGEFASRFTIQAGGTGTLAGNAVRDVTIRYARVALDLGTNRAATLQPSVGSGVLCRPAPGSVTLTGTN